jgi:hypothetical protein
MEMGLGALAAETLAPGKFALEELALKKLIN